MRKIKELSREERNILFWIVNSPPAGQRVLNEHAAKRRLELYKKTSQGIVKPDGSIDSSVLPEKTDLELTENEWDELKTCFNDPGWPTMADRIAAVDLKNKKIMSAEYIEEK